MTEHPIANVLRQREEEEEEDEECSPITRDDYD